MKKFAGIVMVGAMMVASCVIDQPAFGAHEFHGYDDRSLRELCAVRVRELFQGASNPGGYAWIWTVLHYVRAYGIYAALAAQKG